MFRFIIRNHGRMKGITDIHFHRSFRSTSAVYSSTKSPSESAVVVSDDGRTIFCWHPEPQFPYEHTKPLPRSQEENEMGQSVLKVQHFSKRPDGPTDRELMEMFNTNIYPWRYVPQKRKIKPNPPKDRDAV